MILGEKESSRCVLIFRRLNFAAGLTVPGLRSALEHPLMTLDYTLKGWIRCKGNWFARS